MSESQHIEGGDLHREQERQRHEAIKKVYSVLLSGEKTIKDLFGSSKTIHADLDLSWIDPEFQAGRIGSPEEFQVVLAKVNGHQTSNAHYHEVGASTFIVLGQKTGMTEPRNLTYRTWKLQPSSHELVATDEVLCDEEFKSDIPPYTVHQFENKDPEPAYLLIVTHPIISIEEGEEDILFVQPEKV